ncbi:deubiquitinating enzyme [Saitoella coloradoensis]
MSTVSIKVSHAGKKYDVDVDLEEPGAVFKSQLYSLTGVEPTRQKVLVKGGQLKDDTDMKKLGLKPGQTLMMMGTAGELPKAPVQKAVFLEDMTDSQLAEVLKTPAGLQNLGNTCYMNSTLQAFRAIPELQAELNEFVPQSNNNDMLASTRSRLTASLRDLYKNMSQTTEGLPPMLFLSVLRQVFPQFAQKTNEGHYMQQDAEECWSQVLQTLRQELKKEGQSSFVDKYMAAQTSSKLICDENPEEKPVESSDEVVKLDCHISGTTNFMRDGIFDGLTEKIEKSSEALGRNAQYTKTSRLSRLPKYLTVHLVRFYWRRDISKKTKIMRKVAFPFELDATEFCTEDLQKSLIPVRDAMREITKAQEDKERAAKRAKVQKEMDQAENKGEAVAMDVDEPKSEGADPVEEVYKAIDPKLLEDEGANPTGLYDLFAVMTHTGASANSGHWMSWVKQENGDEWYKFNDDKVTTVPKSRIEQLAGGGEADSAYILLYKARELPPKKE